MKAPALNEAFTAAGFLRVVNAVRALCAGGSATIGETVTLAPTMSETVVQDPNCTARSLPVLVPTSLTGVSAQPYVKAVAKGSFTIGHMGATANATLRYELRQPA